MNNITEPEGLGDLKVNVRKVFNSFRQRIQHKLLGSLKTRFELQTENKPVLRDIDIEDTRDSPPNQPIIEGGGVDAWIRISTEKTRRNLASLIIRLYGAWVLIGLIFYVVTGSIWLLVTMGILAFPLKSILAYYFPSRK